MNFNWGYIGAFVLAVAVAVFLSLPGRRTRAEMNRESGQREEAARILAADLAEEPDSVVLAVQLARVYREDGKMDEAGGVLSRAYARSPGDPALQKAYAMFLAENGDVGGALQILPETLRDPEFYNAAAAASEKIGDLALAEKMFLAAHGGDDASDPEVWLRVATFRRDAYDLEGEAAALRRAIALDARNAEAWDRYFVNRVWVIDAEEALRAAAVLDPLRPLGPDRLKIVLSLQISGGDTTAAVATAARIAAFPEADYYMKFDYADLLRRRDGDAAADKELLAFLRDPDLPPGFYNRGIVSLRGSATRRKDLDLAALLAELPAPTPELGRDNAVFAASLILESGTAADIERFLRPVVDDPDAGPEMLAIAFELAVRNADADAARVLADRLIASGADIDQIARSALDDQRSAAEWRRDAENPSAGVRTRLGLARAAAREGDFAGAGEAADAVLAAMDRRDPIVSLGIIETLLTIAAAEPEGSPGRARRLDQALAVVADAGRGPLAKSAWFLIMAADASARKGDREQADRYWKLAEANASADSGNWLAMANLAATRGDEAAVDSILERIASLPDADAPDTILSVVAVDLAVADHFSGRDAARSRRWLDRADAFAVSRRGLLPVDSRDTFALYADLAERRQDWRAAIGHWNEAARLGGDAPSLLGVARATLAGGDHDGAWEALGKADAKARASDHDVRTAIAWQFLAAADASPERDGLRARRQAEAARYAERLLADRWDPALAAGLVDLAVAAGDPDRARSYLGGREPSPAARVSLAEGLMAKGRVDEALAEAGAAAVASDRGIKLRAAAVFGDAGRWDAARALIEEASSAPGPQDGEYLLRLATAYGAVEDYGRQYEAMERRAAAAGRTEWLDAVDRRIWGGDGGGALALLARIERSHPGDAAPIVERALAILVDDNRPGRAVEVYDKALRADPGVRDKLSAEALASLGVASRDLGLSGPAMAHFRRALAMEPGNKRAAMGIARLLLNEGKLQAAMAALRAFVDRNADDPWGWLELANARNATSQSGAREYRMVVELTPPRPDGSVARSVRAARAAALRQLGREQEALAILKATVDGALTDPNVACDYAQMLMETGRYDECDAILREVARLFPHHVWGYRLEATSLVRRKKYDLAVARLEEALAWSPGDGEVQRDLGFAAQLWERTWNSQKGWLSAGAR